MKSIVRASDYMDEESISFSVDKIFYNPNMRFCRSFSSLAVGVIGEKLNVLDGFCASGIRGLRYAKENRNVRSVTFLDWSKNAIALAKKNAVKNKMKKEKSKFATEDITKFLICSSEDDKTTFDFNFIELDPFGTPAPYLFAVFFRMNKCGKKAFYLSATATDTAVLCGHEKTACMKNYHAKSLNNEFTHENGLRILIRRIAEAAAEFNFGVVPLVSLSDRHYLKVIVKCESGADKSDVSIGNFGYISYCDKCGWRESGRKIRFFEGHCARPIRKILDKSIGESPASETGSTPADLSIIEKCGNGNCGNETRWGGPLWLGRLQDDKTITRMRELNSERDYEDKEELDKTLSLIAEENNMPAGYFNIHKMCKRISMKSVPKMSRIIEALNADGFKTVRTHFSDVSVKSTATINVLERALKQLR